MPSPGKYLTEVKGELHKASWPWEPKGRGLKGLKRFKKLTDSTVVILIASALLGGFVALFDLLMKGGIFFLIQKTSGF
ncbi:preprotein translocase subunit SecE [Sulfuriroseicoccus oceanibius]|uniref:Preprotein translocase subunit SecE n=1 Tax=Sulfuriroseicoccus oceanibius TaxID=2707525 RepID=A0A6B3LDU9_9BACT|nr:preprotein translocase subunit SecE [Sulfuriroseicoccus oceanibius]QQL45761.1 preprotein translocase subunit SecE [Sulfuriroseicoccus oceanibius]